MVAATLLACTIVIVLCCDAVYSAIRFRGKEGILLINKVTRYCVLIMTIRLSVIVYIWILVRIIDIKYPSEGKNRSQEVNLELGELEVGRFVFVICMENVGSTPRER